MTELDPDEVRRLLDAAGDAWNDESTTQLMIDAHVRDEVHDLIVVLPDLVADWLRLRTELNRTVIFFRSLADDGYAKAENLEGVPAIIYEAGASAYTIAAERVEWIAGGVPEETR